MKTIRIPVTEFALPCPRRGSIDVYSGYGRASQDGIDIHQLVQAKRKAGDSDYQAEVRISHTFVHGEFAFEVEGRMDGVFFHKTPKIEEIKSSFNVWELLRTIERFGEDHPYVRQVLTYGYLWFKTEGAIPKLSLHLVSSRNKDTRDLPYDLDVTQYEEWLERRLDELVREAIRVEKRVARRKRVSEGLQFPFSKPRTGQIELVQAIEAGMAEHRPMLIQAPTGLGKTVGVLYPSLKESLARGQRVVYVTPKNSQHSVAEDAADRFEESGSKIKSLTITAKSKICMKAEPLCNPSYCEYARDYHEKVAVNDLVEKLGKKRKLTTQAFKKLAEEYEVCPFELQLEASPEADLVICDYNYVFSPHSAFGRLPQISFAQEGQPNLVIDEAHNLPARTMDYYSPALSTGVLEHMREDLRRLPSPFAREGEMLLDKCIGTIIEARPEGISKPARVEVPLEIFGDRDSELRSLLSKYLEAEVEIEPGDVMLRLCFYWGQFTAIAEEIAAEPHPEFFTTFQPDRSGEAIKITCCDASAKIRDRYEAYDQIVGFSATLKPFDFYVRLSGLDPERTRTAEFRSPFSKAHRKLLIIPQISTRFSERERNYSRIAEVISRLVQLRPGNYLAFFPSFDFMQRVAAIFRSPLDFELLMQERNARPSVVSETLERLRAADRPLLLFAVQGGVFSEGVDYPGEMVVGAFVIGPPLPHFDIEREGMKKYYEEKYHEGFGYAYSYPAMAKSVQAAGRVIRSESDRGLIVLMDSRFIDAAYSKSMPEDWFDQTPRELVSQEILKDVEDFWNSSRD